MLTVCHCENELIKFSSCDGKKQNISIFNSQAKLNSSYILSVLTESSLKKDSEMLAIFPTGPSNDLLSESLIYFPHYPELFFPNFTWDMKMVKVFQRLIIVTIMLSTGDEIYLKVLFGQAGKTFTSELVCLLKFYADRSAIERIDLTAAMTTPTLIELFL